jgi:hypothetical protein
MTRASGIIQNFINGVSEQPAAVRLPTQVEAQVNAYSTVVRGLLKRFPTRHVAKLSGFDPTSAYLHTINRGATERYEAAFRTDGIDVVSLVDGASKTVNFATITVTSLDAVTATGAGVAKRVYTKSGDTNLNVITSGTFVGTIQLEESTTGAWAGEETNNGAAITTATTSARTITSGNYYRLKVTAYTSGTITGTIDWKNAGYLQGTPATDLEALTVADYTFVVNKSVTVLNDPNTLSNDNGPEGLIHVVVGSYGRWYRVYVDGTEVANYQAPARVQSEGNSQAAEEAVSTDYITTVLWDGTLGGALPGVNGQSTKDLATDLTAGFTATRHGDNVIKIVKDDGGDFTLTVESDSDDSGDVLRAHKGVVQKFSDLPRQAPEGFQIKVNGWTMPTTASATGKKRLPPASLSGSTSVPCPTPWSGRLMEPSPSAHRRGTRGTRVILQPPHGRHSSTLRSPVCRSSRTGWSSTLKRTSQPAKTLSSLTSSERP